MVEITGVLRFPDGLTPGRAKGGGLSELLFDSDGVLVDHAVFHPGDTTSTDRLSGPVTLQGMAAGAATALAVAGIGYAGFRIRRWFQMQRTVQQPAVGMAESGLGEPPADTNHEARPAVVEYGCGVVRPAAGERRKTGANPGLSRCFSSRPASWTWPLSRP